jgi:glyceraldehyde-3-phosphate dehydrogenase (NADP+)
MYDKKSSNGRIIFCYSKFMSENFFDGISDGAVIPTYRYFDGTTWKESATKKRVPVYSPIDASVIGDLQVVSREEIDEVLKLAKTAQKTWQALPQVERIKIIHLAADWIRHYESFLTPLLVREIGKTTAEAKSEILRTADLTDVCAQEVEKIQSETIDSDSFPGYHIGRVAHVDRVAHGVVLCIAPFNYPVNLSASKIVPALLMGNSVVFKPPTQGGISGIHLVRIFEKAGVPKGVLSCITGGGSEIGDYLVSHKDISMVAFTGSSDVGMTIASKTPMKPLLFECGGNNAAIVLPDADMTLAAQEIVKGAFAYAGQRCTAIKYIMAEQRVLDTLLPEVLEQMKNLVHVGNPTEETTKLVGPVISEKSAQSIEQAIKDAVHEGARIAIGGKRTNTYVEPTILTGVTSAMNIVRTEVFGPVISFIAIRGMEEAASIINEQRFGLQASIFTKDEKAGVEFAKQLDVGTVQINGSPQRGPDHFPFLGVKQSGIGVQGIRYSLEAMSRLKPVVMSKS